MFVYKHTATTEIYTLSLHDALPISFEAESSNPIEMQKEGWQAIMNNFKRYVEDRKDLVTLHFEIKIHADPEKVDRKSTRLNSSHVKISYAVFCLKKKTKKSKYPISK